MVSLSPGVGAGRIGVRDPQASQDDALKAFHRFGFAIAHVIIS
jgi:hypothetical protein